MKTFSFSQFQIEVSFKSMTALVFSLLFLVTSAFAVLHGANAESELNKTIYVTLDLVWLGGIILVTLYCLFVKKTEGYNRGVVTAQQVSFQPKIVSLQTEPEVDYSYIDMCNQ